MNEWTFADEIKCSPLNLPRAALQFAREIAYPTLNVSDYMLKFEDLAPAAQSTMRAGDSIFVKAEILSEFLFQRQGFQGNVKAYGDPQNSFLNNVLERRLGIPISLSVLYMAVARRLQIPAYGVSLPGHFVVMVREPDRQPLFFDPFNGGGRLSVHDCVRLVRLTTSYDGPFQKHWLNAVHDEAILTRMLNNLRLIYIETQQWQLAAKTIKLLQLMHPQAHEFLRDLGVVHYQAGAMREAVNYLESYLQHEPNAPDAAAIREGLWEKIDAWVKMN